MSSHLFIFLSVDSFIYLSFVIRFVIYELNQIYFVSEINFINS